ncbi:MAG: DNA polymerase III subunit gamma/tau [candidate division Zixibacteria bacterium]|nr:DNA polymerase III subunit gamma/tau [candidate division Zixibacteria bacterium]
MHSIYLTMAYQVIALKYRPRDFSEVVAQGHIVTPLRNAVVAGKVHHGYLFTGPRGTGKTTTARILSKALNCENPKDGEPCNQCTPCLEITRTNSPNVIEIDAASNRGIDDIRELREAIRYSPIGAKYKIYIIDEVHQLTSEAFNALLKTLEEPPPHGVFILATTEPQKVPATIMSRCLRFDFRLVPLPKLIETVTAICKKEEVEIEPEGIEAICAKADGSIRDAFSLLDQVLSTGAKKIDAQTATEVLGLVDKNVLIGISEAIAASQPVKAVGYFNEFVRMGGNTEYFVDSLNRHFRDLLVIKLNPDRQSIEGISDDMIASCRPIVEKLDEGQILRGLNVLAELYAGLRRKTADALISVELSLVKMASLSKTVDIERLLRAQPTESAGNPHPKEVDLFSEPDKDNPGTETKAETEYKNDNPHPKPVVTEAKPAPAELTLEFARESWPDVIKELGKKRKTLWAQLNGSNPVSLENNCMTVVVEHEGISKYASTPASKQVLDDLVVKYFGKPLRLDYTTRREMSTSTEVSDIEIQESKRGVTGDKVVDSVLDELGGRLVNWEPKDRKDEE